MKKHICALVLIATSISSAWGQKKRVAVMDFEYGTVQSGVAAVFGQNIDIGKGIADLLVDRLVRDGTYSVIERKALAKLLAEQNFSNSDRADSASAAKIGKLLGVDAIIIGSITQFGRDDRNVGAGGALSRIGGRYGLGNVGVRNSKAVVGISARTVLVETGEIVAVASGKGESTRSGTSLFGAGSGGKTTTAGGVDMASANFANTIIGEAVNAAVNTLRGDLVAGASKLPTKVIPVDGLIADVSGDTLIMNVGARAGVQVGQVLQVVQGGREIRDPATGKVLRRIGTPIGMVKITEADEQSSVGTYSGATKPKVGDQVKSQGK
jgi:curli biogenesis system outer membrane secretion channel CsgG